MTGLGPRKGAALAAALAALGAVGGLLSGCGGDVTSFERASTPEEVRLLRRMRSLDEAVRSSPEDPGPLAELARLLIRRGNFSLAEAYLQKALTLDEGHASSLVLIGTLHLAEGEADRAAREIRRAVAKTPADAEARRLLGLALQQSGRLAQAELELREAVRLKPKAAAYHIDLGGVLFEKGDFGGAEGAARSALALRPGDARARFDLALAQMRLGETERALASALRARSDGGDVADILCLLGHLNIELGHLKEAEECLKSAASAQPLLALPHAMLARLYGTQGREEERTRALEEVVERDYAAVASLRELADVYRRSQRRDGLYGVLSKLAAASRRDSAPRLELARMHDEAGHAPDAVRYYRLALDVDPDCADALERLGMLYCAQQRYDEAKPLFARLLKLRPESAEANRGMGKVLLSEGKLEEALGLMKAAEALAPDDVPIKVDIGCIYATRRLDIEAERYFKRALELDPKRPSTRWNLAQLYLRSDRRRMAVDEFRRYLEISPEDPLGHKALAAVLRSEGRSEEAVASLRKLIELRPDYVWPRIELARAQAELDRPEDAIETCREILLRWPSHADATALLARQLERTGRHAAAIAAYRGILRRTPDDLDAKRRLDSLLSDPAKTAAAMEQLRELGRRRPRDPEVLEEMARLSARGGDARGELDAVEKLVDLERSVPENLYRAAVLHRELKEPELALARYAKLLRLQPRQIEAMADSGEIFLELGRLSQARKSFERAVEAHPGFHRARMGLGRTLEEQGHYRAAIGEYRAAARLRADDMEPLRRMERIYREIFGDHEHATKLAAQIREHTPPPE